MDTSFGQPLRACNIDAAESCNVSSTLRIEDVGSRREVYDCIHIGQSCAPIRRWAHLPDCFLLQLSRKRLE